MFYEKIAAIIFRELDVLTSIQVGSPFTDKHLEVEEELVELIDIFRNDE